MITIVKDGSLLDPEDLDDLREVASQIRGLSEARADMIEYRVTFGWNQPHGPHPRSSPEANDGDPHGHYSTIFAYDVEIASQMADFRYEGRWSQIYNPTWWRVWGPSMDECKELEKLQYDHAFELVPWPEKRHFHAGIQIGSPR